MDVFAAYYYQHNNPQLRRRILLIIILTLLDVMAIMLAFQCSYIINNPMHGGFFFMDKKPLTLLLGILPFWLLVLYLVKITGIHTRRYKVLFFLYLQSSIAVFFILTLFSFFFRLYSFPRFFIAELPALGLLFLFFGRILTYKLFKIFGEKGHGHLNIVMIADDSSLPFINNIFSRKELGYNVVVIFTNSELVRKKYENNSIVLPEKFSNILDDLIEVDFIDEVLYLKEERDSGNVREVLASCEDMGVTFRLICENPELTLSSAIETNVAGEMFLSFINIPNNTYALAIKKALDLNMALLMIVVLSPVLIFFGILIKLTSRGPVLSKIPGTGWRGRQISIYRFRTSKKSDDRKHADLKSELEMHHIGYELEVDSETTIIGRFLLNSGLDQLPQLFNVLKGDIPFIGPRHPLQSAGSKSGNNTTP